MKIGIISDTHDNIPLIKKAVDIFNKENVELVLHAGDIISPFIAPKCFKDLKCKLKLVYGNNDGEKLFLKKKFEEIGAEIAGEYLEFTINNKKIYVTHAISNSVVEALAKSGDYDIIVYGHTHEKVVKKVNNTLIVNPGECCGYLTDESTIAVIDLDKLEAELIKL